MRNYYQQLLKVESSVPQISSLNYLMHLLCSPSTSLCIILQPLVYSNASATFWQDSKASHRSRKTQFCLWDHLYTMQPHRRWPQDVVCFYFACPDLRQGPGPSHHSIPTVSSGHTSDTQDYYRIAEFTQLCRVLSKPQGKHMGIPWDRVHRIISLTKNCSLQKNSTACSPTHSINIHWASTTASDQALRIEKLKTTSDVFWEAHNFRGEMNKYINESYSRAMWAQCF